MRPYNTNSIHWPESLSASCAAVSEETGVETGTDLMMVVTQLEESLRASQQALLLHDLTTFEQQAVMQTSLSKALAKRLRDRTSENRDLRAACSRVLHLGRVHLGLLRRVQRWSRVLSHLLTRPGSGYGSIAELHALKGKKVISQQEG